MISKEQVKIFSLDYPAVRWALEQLLAERDAYRQVAIFAFNDHFERGAAEKEVDAEAQRLLDQEKVKKS